MFWDKVAKLYDLFENYYNGKVNIYNKSVYQSTGETVAKYINNTDKVLECACGTGMLTKQIGPSCKQLIATDYSIGMLKEAKEKCKHVPNVKFRKCDITNIPCKDEVFDKVVAGNVIHLLDNPIDALKELERVCKRGGQLIIPTYVNNENSGKPEIFVQILEKFGAGFKQQFSFESYKEFFKNMGYENIEYYLIEGKMPCAIAVIEKK